MATAVHDGYDIDELVAILTRQRDLYAHLRQIGQKQSDLVERGAAEALLELLAQRQRFIDELSDLNERLAPFREDWPRVWRQVPESRRAMVSELLNTVSDTLSRILEQDDQDRARLAASQDKVKAELGRVSGAAVAVRAYAGQARRPSATPGGAAGASGARFTDQQA